MRTLVGYIGEFEELDEPIHFYTDGTFNQPMLCAEIGSSDSRLAPLYSGGGVRKPFEEAAEEFVEAYDQVMSDEMQQAVDEVVDELVANELATGKNIFERLEDVDVVSGTVPDKREDVEIYADLGYFEKDTLGQEIGTRVYKRREDKMESNVKEALGIDEEDPFDIPLSEPVTGELRYHREVKDSSLEAYDTWKEELEERLGAPAAEVQHPRRGMEEVKRRSTTDNRNVGFEEDVGNPYRQAVYTLEKNGEQVGAVNITHYRNVHPAPAGFVGSLAVYGEPDSETEAWLQELGEQFEGITHERSQAFGLTA